MAGKVMSASAAAKAARAGKDLGKKGPGFANIVEKATPKYGKTRAKKIAGAQFSAMRKKGIL